MSRSTSSIGIVMFLGGFSLAMFLVSTFACNRGGGAIASVDGDAITMEEFTAYIQTKPDARVVTENGSAVLPVDGTLGFQALQDLIGHRVLLKLAKQEGVEPTADDVQKEIEFQKKLRPNFMATLTARGLTLEQIKSGIMLDLAKEKLLTKGIKVTDADVDAYVKANPTEFVEPARVDMSWVYVKADATKAKVDQAIGSGQGFTSVATKFNEYPGARSTGGKFRDPNGNSPAIAALPPILAEAVRATPALKMTNWLRLQDGWAKFYIEKKTADKKITLTPPMREAYRRRIAMERGGKSRDLKRQILDGLKKAKIDVRPKSYKDAWKAAFDKFVSQEGADVPGVKTGR